MQGYRLRALARPAWPALLLCACPQLLDDDFRLRNDELPPGAPAAGGTPAGGAGGRGGDGAAGHAPENGGAAGGGGATRPDTGLSGAAGQPGPGTPDAGSEDPIAALLGSSLVHRYRFDPEATLVDSVGSADAIAVGATFSDGAAVFAGTGQYLDLPNDLLSGLTSTTIEAWVVWTVDDPLASTAWQRIFDFGSNSSTTEGQQGSNANAFFLTPKAGTNGKLHVEYESSGNINLEAPEPLPAQVLVQVVVVVDEDAQILSMYQDGALQGARSFTGSLTTITYRNNWLGRSQYTDDPTFEGRLLDFRIYSGALSTPHVQASFEAGADADW